MVDILLKDWTYKGITVLCKIMKEDTLLSFGRIKEKYSLEAQDFLSLLTDETFSL